MTAQETLKIITKLWCSMDDLKKLTGIGNNGISNIRKKIRSKYSNKKIIPKGYIPMKDVIEYLDIDIDYLKKIAELEKND